ncbi:oxidoreductase [Leptobacterium sp. I13]|uniref:WD40/YVTN/BNR-like repeat-containing protein n=1 Tax=Leptobacterium meishanense TaxID=3128904 RepID=UPI0030EEED07
MKKYIILIAILFCVSCQEKEAVNYTDVIITDVFKDSISIRAIEVMDGKLAFAGSKNMYGMYDPDIGKVKTSRMEYDSLNLQFRAVASTKHDFFMLSIGNPALLFKTGATGKMELVYREDHENVFYDSMKFWNDQEGIAMGDPTDDCLSVIITRDGGKTWKKLSCDVLPKTTAGEAAFAASNTNIAVVGHHAWLVSGGEKSRVFHTPDKGQIWEVFDVPIIQGINTQGIYSVDFYDEQHGFAIGGDYTKPEGTVANKAVTSDGGKTWQLVSDGKEPGYKSCVQYVPNSDGKALVAIGFTGISFSNDAGTSWRTLSEEGFYTLRFVNDTIAYAAGNNRIAKLVFR